MSNAMYAMELTVSPTINENRGRLDPNPRATHQNNSAAPRIHPKNSRRREKAKKPPMTHTSERHEKAAGAASSVVPSEPLDQ